MLELELGPGLGLGLGLVVLVRRRRVLGWVAVPFHLLCRRHQRAFP